VERSVEGRPRRVLARGQARLDLLERERVVAERARGLLEPGEPGSPGLLVALDRRRLAAAGAALVRELDLDDLGLVARLARDHERLGEPESDRARVQVHAGNPNRLACNRVLHHLTSIAQQHQRRKGER
jgi:hypothetical protein